MKTKTLFAILLTLVTLIQLPALAMHGHKHEQKKGKKKITELLVAGTKLCIGDMQIREEEETKNPLSPKSPNLNKELKEKKHNFDQKERKKDLKKRKRHSLSDDLENIEDVREEINADIEALDQEYSKKEELEKGARKLEALEELYGPEIDNFVDSAEQEPESNNFVDDVEQEGESEDSE